MRSMIVVVALLFAGTGSFAGTVKTEAKAITLDKAIMCFVKSLKPEAFTAAWADGGKATFSKRVKNNENMPVIGDQLADLGMKYMSDAAFTPQFLAMKGEWIKQAAAANTQKSVAKAFWDLRESINAEMMTEKGAQTLAKYEGQIRAMAT